MPRPSLLALLLACVGALLWYLLAPAAEPRTAAASVSGSALSTAPAAATREALEMTPIAAPGALTAARVALEIPAAPALDFMVKRVGQSTHWLAGRVLGSGGAGVGQQLVRLVPEQGEPRAQETDAQGHFRFDELQEGSVSLNLAPERLPTGWLLPLGGQPGVGLNLSVPNDGALELRLIRAAVVFGHVRLPDGTPVEGARVRLEPRAKSAAPSLVATSDGAGYFELAGAYPLEYGLRVESGPVQASFARPAALAIAPTEGAGVSAGEIVLGAGSAALAGRLLDQHGEPIAGFKWHCHYGAGEGFWDPDEVASLETDAEGRFLIEGLAPGSVYLVPDVRVPDALNGRGLERPFGAEPMRIELRAAARTVLPDQVLQRRPGY